MLFKLKTIIVNRVFAASLSNVWQKGFFTVSLERHFVLLIKNSFQFRLLYTYSYSAASMLMPVYGAYIFRKKDFCTNQGILASMVGGTVVCIICQIIGTPIPFVAYGLVASIICFFVVGYLTRTPVKAE